MYTKNKIYIIIFLGFISSIILSNYYVLKYDKFNDSGNHILLKDETYYHWYHGAKIVEDVKNGKNFLLSGDIIFTKPLPQRIVALYSLLSGHEIMEEWKPIAKIKLGGKLPFLIIQSLIYYLVLVYLFLKIYKLFPIRNCFYVIFFLAFEHTINQYHSSFWTESIYFSMQIVLIGMLLNKSKSFFYLLLTGVLTGIMFLQRSVAIFYIIPIIIYFIFSYKSKCIKPIIASSIGYLLIISLVGAYNYQKTSYFYIYPSEAKRDVFNFFSLPILSETKNISMTDATNLETKKAGEWIKNNNIILKNEIDTIEGQPGILVYVDLIEKEDDKIRYYNYLNKRQYEIILQHPIHTIKRLIIQVAHFSVLDPIHNYYYNEHRGKAKEPNFINSAIHDKWIPFRIIYSLIIYSICFLGLFYFIKNKKYELLFLLLISVLYNVVIMGWVGWPRFFVPNLIYLSFLFGSGAVTIQDYFYYKKKI